MASTNQFDSLNFEQILENSIEALGAAHIQSLFTTDFWSITTEEFLRIGWVQSPVHELIYEENKLYFQATLGSNTKALTRYFDVREFKSAGSEFSRLSKLVIEVEINGIKQLAIESDPAVAETSEVWLVLNSDFLIENIVVGQLVIPPEKLQKLTKKEQLQLAWDAVPIPILLIPTQTKAKKPEETEQLQPTLNTKRLVKQQKSCAVLSGIFLVAGITTTLPIFIEVDNFTRISYCVKLSDTQPCIKNSEKIGIDFLIQRELRQPKFKQFVTPLSTLLPDIQHTEIWGLVGTGLIGISCLFSKYGTHLKRVAFHKRYAQLKLNALVDNLFVQSTADIETKKFELSNALIEATLTRQTQQELEKDKSDVERQVEYLQAMQQAQVEQALQKLQLLEIKEQQALRKLNIAETDKKREKLNAVPTKEEMLAKDSLVTSLKEHEGGWLWKLLDSQTPLWLTGTQGSAKTWTLATIALCTKYCLDIPVKYVIDAHGLGENKTIWDLLEPEIFVTDKEKMAEVFDSIRLGWLERIKNHATTTPEQIIIDEFTNLRTDIGESVDNFYLAHMTDTRKAKSRIRAVSHNDTNHAYPKNSHVQRQSSTAMIKKFSANGRTPLDRVQVLRGLFDDAGNELEKFECTVPTWFHPIKIYNHFHGETLDFSNLQEPEP